MRLSLRIATVVLLAPLASAQAQTPPEITQHIGQLSAFDFPVRMNAARMLRRVPASVAVPALTEAVQSHADQFVRYRALVLLTGFNDPSIGNRMRSLVSDPNDRVREVAYRWLELHPDRSLAPLLRPSLETEQAEFVRPALVRALAALPADPGVERALVGEVGRGFDFFRSAVIEALGEYRATYALEAVGAVASSDGPLQDDAVLALGRMGDRRALNLMAAIKTPAPAVMPSLQASQCLLGEACPARVDWLVKTAGNSAARPDVIRACLAALGAIARRDEPVRMALLDLAGARPVLREEVSLALSAVALREPASMVAWLGQLADDKRAAAVDLLRDGFESLEEDFPEEQFFAAARAAYWSAPEGSPARQAMAAIIDRLDF